MHRGYFLLPLLILGGCSPDRELCGRMDGDYEVYQNQPSLMPKEFTNILNKSDETKILNCYNYYKHEYDVAGINIINASLNNNKYVVVAEINGVTDLYIVFTLDQNKIIIDSFEYSALHR